MSTAPTLTALQAGTLAAIVVTRTGKGRHKTKAKEERRELRTADLSKKLGIVNVGRPTSLC